MALTARETEVLRLLAEGLRDKTIAERLEIGFSTVRTHLESIYEKLGVEGRSGAVAWACQHGLGPAVAA